MKSSPQPHRPSARWDRWILIVLAFPYLTLTGFSDAIPNAQISEGPYLSSGDLFFVADVIQFEGTDNRNIIEVVYAIDLTQLRSSDGFSATDRFSVELRLTPDDQSVPVVDIRDNKNVSASIGSGGVFVDLVRGEFSAHDFDLLLKLRDGSGRTGVISRRIPARTFGGDLSVSDLLFVSHLQQGDGPSSLSRHGIIMIPSPARHFSIVEEPSTAFLYYEINNLGDVTGESRSYSVHYYIHDGNGQKIVEKTIPDQRTSSPDCSRIERIPLAGMVPGAYSLHLQVSDLANGAAATANGTFRITGPEPQEPLQISMTPETIDRRFKQIEHIASHKEKKIFKSLSLQGKQEFLLRFWKDRDPTPATPGNEFMDEHFRRLAFCETHFQGGSHSDQGRVYIIYGPPLDIERIFSTVESARPVEIWTYATYGRTEFVFVDRTGDGYYIQVHSTHKNEISNPGWRAELGDNRYNQPGL